MFRIVRFIWSVLETGRTKLYHLELHTWVGGKTVFKKEERKIKKDSGFSGQGAKRCDSEVAHRRLVGVLATFYFLNWEGLYEYPPYRILLREYNFNFMYFSTMCVSQFRMFLTSVICRRIWKPLPWAPAAAKSRKSHFPSNLSPMNLKICYTP